MDKQIKYIFMYKNFKVLSFIYDCNESKVFFLEKLEHFDKAPYKILVNKDINLALNNFFRSRIIPFQRANYKEILAATGCKDTFELSFKGHGLSLSNHYWFKKEDEDLKYEDINFFDNKWDDSFAKALINEDYEKLKHCDLNVPDIVTSGWSLKGWIYDNGPKLYKLGMVKDICDDCLCEVLASRLASRLLKENEVVKYELKKINGNYASCSSPFIGDEEELVPLSCILPRELYDLYMHRNYDRDALNEFYKKIKEFNLPWLYEYFIKVQCIKSLSFAVDLHFDNLSAIRNVKTNQIRPAPLFDLAGAFGSSKGGREFVSKLNKGSFLLLYYIFGNLDPSWDYSWYDPKSLDGFEKEIKETLSKGKFYSPELIEMIIDFYKNQKYSLNKLAKNNND